jgi:nitrite reductase/ring-hydroxylating ferredoxin subunit
MSVSNLRIFLLISLFTLPIISCDRDKNDVIPDITVDFTITASDPEFYDLFYAPGTSVLISSAHRYLGQGTAGYDGNGIIIYNASEGLFYAYDRTCPHCFVTDDVSVAVDVDGIFISCPRCSTDYAIGSSGLPLNGPGQYYLKNYRTSFTGYSVRVWNRR